MYYSYVMGIDPVINELKNEGFIIENDGINYMVSFPVDKTSLWEDFISKYLKLGFWNEYIADNCAVFLFHLQDGIKKYEVNHFDNDEVLSLCEKLSNSKFESLETMLKDNHFYKEKVNGFR